MPELNEETVGLLLPVHGGVVPEHLAASLDSVASQVRPPDLAVIVEDGPLGPGLDAVLRAFTPGFPVHRVRLDHNSGVGPALQAGLEALADSWPITWVARMDSDDIAEPDRLDAQLRWLRSSGDDVVGTAMVEFDGTPDRVIGHRVMPSDHADIARLMRRSNPVNHPTVVFRLSTAVAVGGYLPLAGLEDYDLWARMLASGARFHNLDAALVRFRGGPAMLSRRRALPVLRAEVLLQRNLWRHGVVGWPRMCLNVVVRTAFRTLPSPLLAMAYRRLFLRRTT